MRIAELFAEFKASGFSRLSGQMTAMQSISMKTAAAMAAVGKVAKYAFVATGGIIASTTMAASRFNRELKFVSTMLQGEGMKWMPAYEKGLQDLSTTLGESTATLSRGLYDILSASIDPAKALKVLEVASKAAVGGLTDTAVSADALTTILNSYKMSADEAANVSDKLFATVLRGKLTYAELAGSIGKVSATAAISGVSLDELLASVSTITRAGINADLAMTAVVGTLQAFLKPSDDGAKAARKLGFELNTATLKTIGLAGVFKKLSGLKAEDLSTIFPNIRGLKGIAAAMQDQAGFTKDLAIQNKSAGMAEEAFGKMAKGVGYELGKLKQTITASAIVLGNLFSPMVISATKAVKALADAWRALTPASQAMVANVIKWTFAISGAILAVKGLVYVLGPLKVMIIGLFSLLLAHPFIALGVAIAGLIVHAVKLAGGFTRIGAAGARLLKVFSPLVALFKRLKDAIMGLGIGKAIKGIGGWISDMVTDSIIWMTTLIKNYDLVWGIIRDTTKLGLLTIWEDFKYVFTERIPIILKFFAQNWGDLLFGPLVLMTLVLKTMFKNFTLFVSSVFDYLKAAWPAIWTWVSETMVSNISSAFKKILTFTVSVAMKMKELFGMLFDWITNSASTVTAEKLKEVGKAALGEGGVVKEVTLPLGFKLKYVDIRDDPAFQAWKKKQQSLITQFSEAFKFRPRTEGEKGLMANIADMMGQLGRAFDREKLAVKVDLIMPNIKAFALRLWDGIKRAVGAGKGMLGKAASWLKGLVFGPGNVPAAAVAPEEAKGGKFMGFEDVWKTLQSAILGGEDKGLRVQQDQLDVQNLMLKELQKVKPAVAGK